MRDRGAVAEDGGALLVAQGGGCLRRHRHDRQAAAVEQLERIAAHAAHLRRSDVHDLVRPPQRRLQQRPLTGISTQRSARDIRHKGTGERRGGNTK